MKHWRNHGFPTYDKATEPQTTGHYSLLPAQGDFGDNTKVDTKTAKQRSSSSACCEIHDVDSLN